MASCDGTNLSELYAHVMPELPKCPKPLILNTIRQVLRSDFFPQTQVWTYEMDPIDIRSGQSEYDFEWPETCSDVDTVKLVTIDDVVQEPLVDYVLPDKTKLQLVIEPGADTDADQDGLEITLVLKPKLSITKICCTLYDEHFQTWAYGVMSKLMKMKGKPWSDARLADEYLGYYLDGKAEARHEQDRGLTVGELKVRPDYDFA